MSFYDFKQLSPHDFELLSRDLIQARDAIQLESFKTGRDKGIDFRCAGGAENLIVQAKHYVVTGLKGLLRDLKKEAGKAKQLNCSRYILVTSVGLTPPNKDEIMTLFGGMIHGAADIIGPDDLNNLLEQFEAIHKQHHKLWLGSRAVLDRVLHNASVTQSEFDTERVHKDISRYVRSAAYPRAIDMLNGSHITIISGVPGVGKTTLARMLLYAFLEQGYEVISILTDFQTARERYQPGEKQIFYFDDFIGATFLGDRASVFTRNEDRAILDFIEMVRSSKTARLVMTTREHILQQAIVASEKLKNSRLVDRKCVLEIDDYSRFQRGEILYNHIYFSALPPEYSTELLSNRFYLEIVNHKKFNPRLIEWLSDYQRVQSIPSDQYKKFVRNLLDDPADIWRHAYQEQISDAGRSVLLALYTYNGNCHPAVLKKAFWAIHKLRAANYGFKTDPADWRRGLSELNGSFIRPGDSISVIDPSVLDMLNAVLREDTGNALDMIEGAVRFEQANRVWKVAKHQANQSVGSFLYGERERVAAAFIRLLNAPDRRPLGTGIAFFDDSQAERLTLMLDIAERFQVESLISVIQQHMATMLAAWQAEHFHIHEVVLLAQSVAVSEFVFGLTRDLIRDQLLTELSREAASGCGSDELRSILDEFEDDKFSTAVKVDLAKAARKYQNDRQSEEFRGSKSEGDFEALEEDLVAIADRLGIDMAVSLEELEEAKLEFGEHQSSYEDAQYDEWKETRHFGRAADRDLDDLFDSLRG